MCKFIDYDKMYRDSRGRVADIVIFTRGVSARMNNDQMFKHHMAAYILEVKHECQKLMAAGDYDKAWQHTLTMYAVISPTTHESSMRIMKSKERIKRHLHAIYDGDNLPRVTIRADDTHIGEEMYDAMMEHMPPLESEITFINDYGEKETLEKKAIISYTPIGILEKTQHNKLAECTAQQQHHGLPTSTSNKGEHPSGYKQHAPKVMSETETRMMSHLCGSVIVAQIMDQATNSKTSEACAEAMFSSKTPGGDKVYVDRRVHPMGNNSSLALIRHEFENEGSEFVGTSAKELSDSIGWDKR